MNIDTELRRALRRQPAPIDLAARVLRRIEDEKRAESTPNSQSPTPKRARTLRLHSTALGVGSWELGVGKKWMAAAAAIVLTLAGGLRYYEYQQTVARAERAQQELRLALEITSERLARVQRIINEAQESPR